MNPRETALLRMVAQRLAGPPLSTPAEAVIWLGAVQGQDLAGAVTSVALRTRDRSRVEVEAALDDACVVRSWPMRGTLHLTPAADLGWMLGLTSARTLARAARRRTQLGLDDAAIARARDVATAALDGGRRASRAAVMALWEEAGLAPAGGRGYHLLFHLATTGVLCYGPLRDGEQQLVLLPEWVPSPARPERDEALGTWAERFFRSHGPATAADFSRWTGLPSADVRTATTLARERLESVQVDGVEHLLDPATAALLDGHRAQARAVALLPGFDELILGYADRSCTLDREHERRVVPGGNGVFAPTVVAGGRVVGTWRHTGRGAARRLQLTPFDALSARRESDAARAYAALPDGGTVGAAHR